MDVVVLVYLVVGSVDVLVTLCSRYLECVPQ